MATETQWANATIKSYVTPDELDGEFLPCKVCGEKPRIWVFDNGRHAKCLCGGRYSASRVKAESILSVIKRTGGSTLEYDILGLSIAWNKWIETGKPQSVLPEGRW